MERPSFTRRMEAAKRDAIHHRNAGRHVGASAKGWDFKRPDDGNDDYTIAARIAWDGWRLAYLDARNDFAAACLNLKHREDYSAIPF